MRRAILERFREEHGEKRIGLLHKKALQAILNKKSPAAASNWRKALRGFIDHAMSLDMLATDPLAGVKLLAVKSDGHHPWEMEECAKFEAHHSIGTRLKSSEITNYTGLIGKIAKDQSASATISATNGHVD